MEEDDRYTRITLRVPKDIHARLAERAFQASKSINAEIVGRLTSSLTEEGSGDFGPTVKSLAYALAKAQVETSTAAIQAQGRLFEGALVASALLKLIDFCKSAGYEVTPLERSLIEEQKAAYRLIREADQAQEGFESFVAKATAAAKRFQGLEAEQRPAPSP